MKPSRWANMFIITVCALMSLGAVTSRCGDEYPPGWEHEVFDFPIPHVMPSWTPDGLHVVLDQHVIDIGGTNFRSIVPESFNGAILNYTYSTNVSPVEPRVTYMTLRHGNGLYVRRAYSWDIVASNLDGSSYERLTSEESLESNPIWSTGGERIAFFSNRETRDAHKYHLFVMDKDGSNVRNLTPTTETSQQPAVWSPDDKIIAFWALEAAPQKKEGTGHYVSAFHDQVLHVVDVDGSKLRRVRKTANRPAWSPDGDSLAFIVGDNDDSNAGVAIAIVSLVDDSEVRTIPIVTPPLFPGENVVNAGAIAWSVDGSELRVVTCHENPKVTRVYSLKADGAAPPELVGQLLPVSCPFTEEPSITWSPDRTSLAISVGDSRAFTIAADGSDYRLLVVKDEDRGALAANAPRQQFAEDIPFCSQGFVVPRGSYNSGLRQDCETLLSIASEMIRADVEVNWGAHEMIGDWDGVIVGGDPPRVTGLTFDTDFAGSLHPGLVNLAGLETLSVASFSTSLVGPIPPYLGDLKSLKILRLRAAGLYGTIPPELGKLENLRELDLSRNRLVGPIPLELGNMSNLEVLNLEATLLTGSIPSELGNLTKLQSLYLQRNYLTGEFPLSLTHIPSLEDVDIRDTNLTGCVPWEFLENTVIHMSDRMTRCRGN